MNRDDAEEYTQSLGQIGGGLWRQILWAAKQGVPEALGLTLRDWVDGRLGGYVKMAVNERRHIVAELTKPIDEGGEGLTQQQAADVVGVTQQQVSIDLADTKTSKDGDQPTENLHVADLADTKTGNRADEIQELARQRTPEPVHTPALPDGPFACLVIDPPWPMRKIERRRFPWQGVELDYPVMDLVEIEALPIERIAACDAHLYLWVTHRFLPDGLRLTAAWGFRYQCLMTWNKPSGMVPYSWMYDTEHVIFAARGNLKLAKRGLRLSFEEPVNGHSTKPDVFYDRVRNASPEPRLEMFARRERPGFVAWGAEAPT
jgi:N6-adenosine-specific RNA methylase IME4